VILPPDIFRPRGAADAAQQAPAAQRAQPQSGSQQ
jgi:hypothetical protein